MAVTENVLPLTWGCVPRRRAWPTALPGLDAHAQTFSQRCVIVCDWSGCHWSCYRQAQHGCARGECVQAVVSHYSRDPDSRTLAERQRQAAAAVEFLIRCSSALVLLGAQKPPALQALLLQVIPDGVLQQGPSPAAAALLAAGTEAVLCGSEGQQPDPVWGSRLAAAVAAVVPVAGGADCCRLAVCLATAGVQLGQHQQLKGLLLQQVRTASRRPWRESLITWVAFILTGTVL